MMRRNHIPIWGIGALWVVAAGLVVAAQEAYEVGGPLAGVKLPLFPTQQGEQPGHPGCLPGQYDSDLLQPVFELNPGSPELYRNYWLKYCPVRSFFDRQSRVRHWVAPNIPGVAPGQVEAYAAPLYWVPRHEAVVDTGLKWKSVPVVRCREGAPVIRLDLGELDRGVYAIRLIAAVETRQLRPFRLPLYLRAQINDGLHGEENTYRLRLGYCDEFYSVAEVYFHAVEKRSFRAELTVDRGSQVDLLLHEISVDDVLAGVQRRAIKTRTTLNERIPPFPGNTAPITPEERLRRDALLWEGFPPTNAQGFGFAWLGGDEHVLRNNVTIGVPGKTAREIADEFGAWESGADEAFLVNKKLNLTYSMQDLRLHQPLPDPYPYKDDGAGLFFPDPNDPGKGCVWSPIAMEVENRIRNYPNIVRRNVERYLAMGDLNAARDAAVALVRFAYAFPTLDAANYLLYVTRDPGPYGRDIRCRRRDSTAMFYSHYAQYVDPILYDYDRLFDYLKADTDLAQSIGRFVPWVKRPQDVIELIDGYLVQTTAKRILRYHYYTDPVDIANAAAVLGDNAVTDPWMEWLFSRTFIYPLPPVGIQDAMITGCCRDGCEYIGSTYYAQGEGAMRVGEALQRYLKAGGNRKYDLTDPVRYPKLAAQCFWRLKNVVAGWDFLRIGDVTGPDKAPGHTLLDLSFARQGWQWTRDPRFAFVLKHYVGRTQETDAEWAAIEQAALQCPRAPWLENRSRVMPMWAGILESGLQHDDPRFRRAAYVRVGFGWGHQHSDTMDLQVVAHGQPATIDGGQRGGYSTPGDANTRVHNVVEVDGKSFQGYSWVSRLTDTEGARSLQVEAEPPENTTLFRRQVALVDVDEGQGSQPLLIPQQRPGARLPEGILPANSYVFDVFRVAGGQMHTYCFHGPVDDDFQWNVADAKPVSAESEEGQYLRLFKNLPERKFAGTAPDLLEATWRQTRSTEGLAAGSEQRMLGANFNPSLPRRFTRLHLLGVQGARALRANLDCFQWKYNFTCLMVQKKATSGQTPRLETAFVALVEPYVGEPFLAGKRLLEVVNNERDAQKAVAVEVRTANGHTDFCFADGRPDRIRQVRGGQGPIRVAAEFAYYSTDANGLRQATVSGGTLLEGPHVTLRTAQRERTGEIVKVDYWAKSFWINRVWPAWSQPGLVEVGVPGHWTTYTALRVVPEGNQSRLMVDGGADYYRSPIEAMDPQKGTVRCTLGLAMGNRPGIDRHWVASNEEQTTFWRADVTGDRTFRLVGAPVSAEAFGAAKVLRLWEYGVGDTVRQATFASLRRLQNGLYELTSNTDVTVTLPGKGLEGSPDQSTWKAVGRLVGNRTQVSLTVQQLGPDGKMYLRVK